MRTSGVTEPCTEYGCSLCDILKRNVYKADFPQAVRLSGHYNRSVIGSLRHIWLPLTDDGYHIRANSLPSSSRRSGGDKVLVFAKIVSSVSAPEMTEEQAHAKQGSGRRLDVVRVSEDVQAPR